MSELICEEIAHLAGFIVSVGNWIAPDGSLIASEDYESHHWETIKKHLGYEPETENHLRFMNEKVEEGYVRLVFRSDVLFQVNCKDKEEIWGDAPNMVCMRGILAKIPNVEIHIFTRAFYVIGNSQDILNKSLSKLQIQEA